LSRDPGPTIRTADVPPRSIARRFTLAPGGLALRFRARTGIILDRKSEAR
jgi:hypothetical protein